MLESRRTALALYSILALSAWAVGALSCVLQKMDADRQIAQSLDISAIQIQQLNGSVTAHILTCMIVASACTLPLLVYAATRIVLDGSAGTRQSPPTESGGPVVLSDEATI